VRLLYHAANVQASGNVDNEGLIGRAREDHCFGFRRANISIVPRLWIAFCFRACPRRLDGCQASALWEGLGRSWFVTTLFWPIGQGQARMASRTARLSVQLPGPPPCAAGLMHSTRAHGAGIAAIAAIQRSPQDCHERLNSLTFHRKQNRQLYYSLCMEKKSPGSR